MGNEMKNQSKPSVTETVTVTNAILPFVTLVTGFVTNHVTGKKGMIC